MPGQGWTLDDIPWERFDPAKVDPEILKVIKAASMVEANGGDYATYLCNVFPDDAEFQRAARDWAEEEVQHGRVLARWAALADSGFDFEASFRRFTAGYRLPLDAKSSVRGSRSGELVARCIVEVGTSSYYTALLEAAEEPVLREICRRIAADELRHYKLFYTHLKRYLERERIGKWRRLMVALGRMGESEDDELAYAYYAANGGNEPYDRRRWARAYLGRAYSYYRHHHIERVVAMILKAAGLKTRGHLARWSARFGYWLIRTRSRHALAAEA
ncbi:MAG: ferritin-like domain-containing protein [Rhodospirillales bacterium]|nr:ferritin-like domain-containing protein [Rhodospirillales bacterium]